MFYLTRRQTRTALAAGAGAAVYLAASEIGKDKLKLTGLFVLASASMAGMVTAKASAKAYSAHQRIDVLVPAVQGKYDKTGGTISGSVTVTGNHTIQGSLIGSGGTIDVSDQFNMQGNTIATVQNIARDPGSGSANVNITGGGLGVNGNINMNGNDMVVAGTLNGNSLNFSNTTGQPALNPAAATYSQGEQQGQSNRINSFLSALG